MPPAAGRPVGIRQPGHRCLPAETVLDRYRAHTLVKGAASPDDPALATYWADRLLKMKPRCLVITLLFLAQMRWTQLPSCGPAGAPLARLPARCIALAERYPLRFLYGYQGVPKIDKLALVKDWAQW